MPCGNIGNMEHVFFSPWVGKDYATGGIFGKKILVLGESHYCDIEDCDRNKCGKAEKRKECGNFTTNVTINTLLNGETTPWTGTFRKFERSLVGHDTDVEESKRIWNSVAFYNYIQKAMTEARTAAEPEDFEVSKKAFYEVLEELQPDLIIAWGVTRMYDDLPGEGWEAGPDMIVDEYAVPNGYYTLRNGHRVRIIFVYHPSAGYSWDWWHKVIKSEL